MIKQLLPVFLLLLPVSLLGTCAAIGDSDSIPHVPAESFAFFQVKDSSEIPPLPVLKIALAGYELLVEGHTISKPEVITIIDFSLPSNKERLWVLDLINKKILYHCLVSHGRNSGEVTAGSFSNVPGSNASSPGFYTTGETYFGKHGLSLSLDGLESGINDNARARAIVIHGADYVSSDFIRAHGRLGRSLGCPAIPVELSTDIIQTIKGGSCIFIYVPIPSYTSNSPIINRITSIKKS